MASQELTDLSIANTPEPVTLETAQETLDRAKAMTTNIQPTVSANDLSNPVTPVAVPEPAVATIPDRVPQTVNNVAENTLGTITAEQSLIDQRNEAQASFGALTEGQSLQDLFTSSLGEGFDDSTNELKDISLQLADMQTSSELTKVGIQGAAGQTLGQAQREVTQEDQEQAVRSAGLAARAAVLQGNINTAISLAKDTVDLAFKDRQLKSENLLNQIDMLQGQVDDQTAQLLEKERRTYEAELETIKELKENIANAMVSGASQQEITQLNDPTLDDASKLALAQQITARNATSILGQEDELRQAQIASSNRANRPTPTKRSTSVIEQDGRKLLIDTQTGEIISEFGVGDLEGVEPFTEQQEVFAQDDIILVDSLKTHEGLSKAVGVVGLARFTPFKADVLTGEVADFVATVDQFTKDLTLKNLIQAKSEGATFGALSNAELALLSQSATKINSWREGEKNEEGIVIETTHYKISEDKFKQELDKISNFRKLDFVLKGGNPESVGIQRMEDGTYWTVNSDGSFTQISKEQR